MRSREVVLLSTALALLALAGLAWFGHEALAVSEAPPAMGGPATNEHADVDPIANAAGPEVASAPLPAQPVDVAQATTGEAAERVDTAKHTSGVIKGDIQLAVSAIPRIRSIRVEVAEARNATPTNQRPPVRLIHEVTMGRGTPTFVIEDVPFSDYPYIVSVWSPGLNGSRTTISVDANKPVVDHLLLQITPGTPLSVLVRDQDAAPFLGLDLVFLPIGEPAGRTSMKGSTDNFGSLVFDDVLAGDYQVLVTQNNLQVLEPQTMSVGPGGSMHGQSYQLTIERGVPVQVKVHDRNFYPYVGAKVVATATDRIRLTVREATSDATGVAAFAHLQPGTWQVTVTQDKCYLWDQQITVKPYQDPIVLDALMAPIR
jgi:hypothetical protein